MSAPVVNTERMFKIQDAMKDDYSDILTWAAVIGFAFFLMFKYETKKHRQR